MPPIVNIINILAAIVTVLVFLLNQTFIPPEWLPFIAFAVVVLNGAIDLLRVLFPQRAGLQAALKSLRQ